MHPIAINYIIITVASQVSAHGRLNIPRNFGPCTYNIGFIRIHKLIEAVTLTPRNAVHGHLIPGSAGACLPNGTK